MLLGNSSVSTDYSVEDLAGLLQYEIPWNVTWIPAEISWVRDHNHSAYVFFLWNFFENRQGLVYQCEKYNLCECGNVT